MKLDPITQYILEVDADAARATVNRVGSAAANQAKNKAIKAGGYVASKYRAKFGKQLTHDKCQQLHDIGHKHSKQPGQCSGAKADYYKHLTHICNDGFRLQAIFTQLNTKLMRPKTKAAKQAEAQRIKQRILAAKDKLNISKELVSDKCREEAEKALYDRDKEQAAKVRAKAKAKKLKAKAKKVKGSLAL